MFRASGKFYIMILIAFLSEEVLHSESFDSMVGELHQDRAAMIQGYVRLVASAIVNGYHYFSKEKASYDLQTDVLDIPYKNMIYLQTQAIEKLFDDANKHDNPLLQTRALILLCRVSIPEWYLKSFSKGLETMHAKCFDRHGNFIDASSLEDIRLIFKDYYRKVPGSWQELAKISSWRCKNKKPYSLHTQYYAHTCTEHNYELLCMSESDQLEDIMYVKYLLMKNGSKAAHKIYDYQIATFLKINKSQFRKS
jgi:hypothetical protein